MSIYKMQKKGKIPTWMRVAWMVERNSPDPVPQPLVYWLCNSFLEMSFFFSFFILLASSVIGLEFSGKWQIPFWVFLLIPTMSFSLLCLGLMAYLKGDWKRWQNYQRDVELVFGALDGSDGVFGNKADILLATKEMAISSLGPILCRLAKDHEIACREGNERHQQDSFLRFWELEEATDNFGLDINPIDFGLTHWPITLPDGRIIAWDRRPPVPSE